jgi:hypothetical protein
VAATCALTFAWVIVTPWSLPRNALTRWLTLATGTLAILHFNGSHPMNTPIGPTP